MFRKAAAKKIQTGNPGFKLRGHEVKRIEAFSDAVFAFAVTLLIVSLEVPKSFEELMITIHGFFAFGISFLLLMLIWHEQNIFFRRYGLDDTLTIILNGALIFIVLFYVYPLKFLFTLVISGDASGIQLSIAQVPMLMSVYGIGFAMIYLLFFFMYRHALSKEQTLELTVGEQFDTRTKMYAHFVFVMVALTSVLLTWTLPPGSAGLAGPYYGVIGPALTILYGYRSRRRKKMNF